MQRWREGRTRAPRIASNQAPSRGLHTLNLPNAAQHLQHHHLGEAAVDDDLAAVRVYPNGRCGIAAEFLVDGIDDAPFELRVRTELRNVRRGGDGKSAISRASSCERRKSNSGEQEKGDA